MAKRVCPFWIGYALASPLRKLYQDPFAILSPHVRPGMTVLDIGSAMGFFTIPLAELVGENGRVIAIDMQERMLDVLMDRADKSGVSKIIEVRACRENSLCIGDLIGAVDFALAFAVVHEVPEAETFFR